MQLCTVWAVMWTVLKFKFQGYYSALQVTYQSSQ